MIWIKSNLPERLVEKHIRIIDSSDFTTWFTHDRSQYEQQRSSSWPFNYPHKFQQQFFPQISPEKTPEVWLLVFANPSPQFNDSGHYPDGTPDFSATANLLRTGTTLCLDGTAARKTLISDFWSPIISQWVEIPDFSAATNGHHRNHIVVFGWNSSWGRLW